MRGMNDSTLSLLSCIQGNMPVKIRYNSDIVKREGLTALAGNALSKTGVSPS